MKNWTLHDLIAQAIVEDPPFSVREGGMIKPGYSDELDTYTKAKTEGKAWIEQMEEEEREKTGIKNLKIRFNKVFGYYLEVTKSNLEDVPENYIRKQTLANCERFITPELNDLAELILGSEEKIVDLEYQLFTEIRNAVAAEVERIQLCAHIISVIDALQSLAEVAEKQNYTKPVVDEGDIIDIKEGRHPVVEKAMAGLFPMILIWTAAILVWQSSLVPIWRGNLRICGRQPSLCLWRRLAVLCLRLLPISVLLIVFSPVWGLPTT